jgi:release factor glutamine methyltransferase
MKTLPQSFRSVVNRLREAGCVAAREEAGELVEAAPDEATLEAFVGRRSQGEPLGWITGRVQFCGHSVRVDRGVYVPRMQTEELARRAASVLSGFGPHARAADLCTGSGAIAVHLQAEVPFASVVGVDSDELAARCSRHNNVLTVVGDLGAPLCPEGFDVVTAVPPYVPTTELKFLARDVLRYEPLRALDGGSEGLDVLRRLVESAARLLRPGAWLLVELGGQQDRQLAPALDTGGFVSVTTWTDEDGDLRGLAARRSPHEP